MIRPDDEVIDEITRLMLRVARKNLYFRMRAIFEIKSQPFFGRAFRNHGKVTWRRIDEQT